MIEGFLTYLSHERAYSLHTVASYESDLLAFKAYLDRIGEGYELKEANTDLIRRWAMELMASGAKASSVNRKLSSLRTFYKYLLRKGIIAVSPMQNMSGPKRAKPLPQFVRENDMERLLCATAQGESWKDIREHTALQLFYETGIRLSELVGLNDADVDFGRKAIKVTGKRNKQRIIPIGDGMTDSLRRYMEARPTLPREVGEPISKGQGSLPHGEGKEAPLFITDKGNRVYPSWVYRMVRKHLSQVVTLKKRSPHVLRHTFATTMLNNEAELEAVKELMGHESVSTTQIYTHTTFEELKKAYKQAHPRASINQ